MYPIRIFHSFYGIPAIYLTITMIANYGSWHCKFPLEEFCLAVVTNLTVGFFINVMGAPKSYHSKEVQTFIRGMRMLWSFIWLGLIGFGFVLSSLYFFDSGRDGHPVVGMFMAMFAFLCFFILLSIMMTGAISEYYWNPKVPSEEIVDFKWLCCLANLCEKKLESPKVLPEPFLVEEIQPKQMAKPIDPDSKKRDNEEVDKNVFRFGLPMRAKYRLLHS